MFVATLFEVARNCKQRRCPSSEEWIKKIWHIYTMEYYFAGGKRWNLEIHRKINGSLRNHPELGKPVTKEQHGMYSLIYRF